MDPGEEEAGLAWGLPQGGSIPFQSVCREQMASGRVEMVPRTVPGAGQLRPHGSLSQDGPQGPGRSQTRSCVHRSAAATHAGLGELPSGSPASEAQSLAQTLPKPHRAPQNKPPVLAQHLSQRAKRTQQTPETPSHRCHLASSLQPNPLPNSGAVERRSCDTTVL